jgi:hypothetical protein
MKSRAQFRALTISRRDLHATSELDRRVRARAKPRAARGQALSAALTRKLMLRELAGG